MGGGCTCACAGKESSRDVPGRSKDSRGCRVCHARQCKGPARELSLHAVRPQPRLVLCLHTLQTRLGNRLSVGAGRCPKDRMLARGRGAARATRRVGLLAGDEHGSVRERVWRFIARSPRVRAICACAVDIANACVESEGDERAAQPQRPSNGFTNFNGRAPPRIGKKRKEHVARSQPSKRLA